MKAKILPFIAVAAFMLGIQSCKKPGDTTAVITVVNSAGTPVSGATVYLIGVDSYGDPGGRIDEEASTDGTGKATFNFNDLYKRGEAGFAVLDVRVEKDTLYGTGIIKVEEEKTSEATITIQ